MLWLLGCSVAKSCTRVCDPMECSAPDSSILHYLLEVSIESVMLSKHLIVCSLFSSCPQSFPESGSFPLSQLCTSCGQNIGASTSASILPMNIQGWFPLEFSGLIALQYKGLSRVFPSTTVFKSINSSVFSLLYGRTLTSVHDYWKNYSFDYTDLCRQSDEPFLLIAIQLEREWTCPEFQLCFRALC